MSDGAKLAVKKRKAAAGAAASPAAGSKKLANGIGSLLARLEATNASFLHTAATNAMHTQLAKVCVQGKFADGLLPLPQPDGDEAGLLLQPQACLCCCVPLH